MSERTSVLSFKQVWEVHAILGFWLGLVEGSLDGLVEGSLDGKLEGLVEGSRDGKLDGLVEGSLEGLVEGSLDGKLDGFLDGTDVGEYVFSLQSPTAVHASVQSPVVAVVMPVGGWYAFSLHHAV